MYNAFQCSILVYIVTPCNAVTGYKIPVIENLSVLYDQFDTIDFCDNDIRKLDGFPVMKRLKSILLNNNRIVSVLFYLSIFTFLIFYVSRRQNTLLEKRTIDYKIISVVCIDIGG